MIGWNWGPNWGGWGGWGDPQQVGRPTGWRHVAPPAVEPLSLAEVKTFLKVDHTNDDTFIGLSITGARQYIEKRDLIIAPQTWAMYLDRFPLSSWHPILLWKQPVLRVQSITYIDTDGNLQTWNSAEYQAVLNTDQPRIVPAYGGIWPTARCQPESVTVQFDAGYSNSPVETPATLLNAMLLMIGHLYTNREAVVVLQGVVSIELPHGLEDLINSVIERTRVY